MTSASVGASLASHLAPSASGKSPEQRAELVLNHVPHARSTQSLPLACLPSPGPGNIRDSLCTQAHIALATFPPLAHACSQFTSSAGLDDRFENFCCCRARYFCRLVLVNSELCEQSCSCHAKASSMANWPGRFDRAALQWANDLKIFETYVYVNAFEGTNERARHLTTVALPSAATNGGDMRPTQDAPTEHANRQHLIHQRRPEQKRTERARERTDTGECSLWSTGFDSEVQGLARLVVRQFASASCREASGTSRPGSPPQSLGAAANRCRGGSRLSAAPTRERFKMHEMGLHPCLINFPIGPLKPRLGPLCPVHKGSPSKMASSPLRFLSEPLGPP